MAKQPELKTVLLYGGLVYLAYLVAKKLGLVGNTGAEDTSCVGPYTLSTLDARMICDGIEAAATGFTEDEGRIVQLLQRANRDGDVCRLLTVYGSRQIGAAGVPFTLVELVTTYLSQEDIQAINDNWASKGIQYRF
jgi:hypothetical protein